MKGPHPEKACYFAAGDAGDPLLHLSCSLVSKSKRKDLSGLDTLPEEMCNTVSENAGLAGTGTGYHECRAFSVDNCLFLSFVQIVKIIMNHLFFRITAFRVGQI
jgi:hypothetical protein